LNLSHYEFVHMLQLRAEQSLIPVRNRNSPAYRAWLAFLIHTFKLAIETNLVHTPAPSGSELLASGIQIVARNGETSFSPRLSNLALCYYGLHNNTDKTEY
jgi:hypothetical protein